MKRTKKDIAIELQRVIMLFFAQKTGTISSVENINNMFSELKYEIRRQAEIIYTKYGCMVTAKLAQLYLKNNESCEYIKSCNYFKIKIVIKKLYQSEDKALLVSFEHQWLSAKERNIISCGYGRYEYRESKLI